MKSNYFMNRLSIVGRWVATTVFCMLAMAFVWQGGFFSNTAMASPAANLVASADVGDRLQEKASEGARKTKNFIQDTADKVERTAKENAARVEQAKDDNASFIERKAKKDAAKIEQRAKQDAGRTQKAVDKTKNAVERTVDNIKDAFNK